MAVGKKACQACGVSIGAACRTCPTCHAPQEKKQKLSKTAASATPKKIKLVDIEEFERARSEHTRIPTNPVRGLNPAFGAITPDIVNNAHNADCMFDAEMFPSDQSLSQATKKFRQRHPSGEPDISFAFDGIGMSSIIAWCCMCHHEIVKVFDYGTRTWITGEIKAIRIISPIDEKDLRFNFTLEVEDGNKTKEVIANVKFEQKATSRPIFVSNKNFENFLD